MNSHILMMVGGFGSCLMLFYTAALLSNACSNARELGKGKTEYWFLTCLYYAAVVLALLSAVVGIKGLIPALMI